MVQRQGSSDLFRGPRWLSQTAVQGSRREGGEDNVRMPEVCDVETTRGPVVNSKLRHSVAAEQWEKGGGLESESGRFSSGLC